MERFGEDKVQMAHGRLDSVGKSSAMETFAFGDVPILVATTVIEVSLVSLFLYFFYLLSCLTCPRLGGFTGGNGRPQCHSHGH